MEITREMKMQMFSMKLDGKSVYEIAKNTGCSAEDVANALDINLRKMTSKKKILYPGIEAWMQKYHLSAREFAAICDIPASSVNCWLLGLREIHKPGIDKILRATGMTYEEAFGDPREESENA